MALKRINLGTDSSGRPLVLDARTHAKFTEACRRLGFNLTIVQGSYRGGSGAAASAGTHDRGGVIDIRTWNIPANIGVAKTVRVLRECGLIAWYRTQAQGFDPHIHAIDHGNPELAPSAARQVTAWKNGRNGLASNGPDDGPRITIPTAVPQPPKKERDPMADYAKQLTDIQKTVNLISRQLVTANTRIKKLAGVRKQLTKVRKHLDGENAKALDEILAAIDELED